MNLKFKNCLRYRVAVWNTIQFHLYMFFFLLCQSLKADWTAWLRIAVNELLLCWCFCVLLLFCCLNESKIPVKFHDNEISCSNQINIKIKKILRKPLRKQNLNSTRDFQRFLDFLDLPALEYFEKTLSKEKLSKILLHEALTSLSVEKAPLNDGLTWKIIISVERKLSIFVLKLCNLRSIKSNSFLIQSIIKIILKSSLQKMCALSQF